MSKPNDLHLKEGDPCECDPVPPDPARGDLHRPGPDLGQHRGQDQGAEPRQGDGPPLPLGVQGQHPGHLGGQSRAGKTKSELYGYISLSDE